MNSRTWKWILAANCLIASSASFAGTPAGLRNSIADPIRQPKSIFLDKSKFQYMDSAPIYNNHHVRAAVMVYERKPDKQSQCTALKGKAKHRCYELAMPT
jgi:hypothetical protein